MTTPTTPAAEPTAAQALALFDQIAGAVYYGAAFRVALRNDPEAFAAATALVARLRARNVPGIDPEPTPVAGPTDDQVDRLADLATATGRDDCLDEIVIDNAHEAVMSDVNSTDDDDDQERLLAGAEGVASDINNNGPRAQVRYLLECGVDEATIEVTIAAGKAS